MFSIYSVIYFFYTTISSLKKDSIIIKLFNFVSTITGLALSLELERIENSNRLLKIILFLIPEINIYNAANLTIIVWDEYKYSDIFSREIKGITYFESVIFFIVEIIFYSTLLSFIQSYKNSGLTFCQYLSSFCH